MKQILLVTMLLALAPSAAPAVEDLLDIYQAAERQDPDLASARAASGAAGARYRQARGRLLPQLSGDASFSKQRQDQNFEGIDGNAAFGGGAGQGEDDDEDEFRDQQSLTLNLNQALFDWSAWQAKDAAAVRAEQANNELAAASGDLIVRSARAYFDVLAARAALDAARRQGEVIGKQLDRARAAFESGLAPITDLQQAQSQLDSVRVDGISAENDLANSRDALLQLTGSVHPQLAVAPPPYEVSPPADSVDQWVSRALERNPQLAARRSAFDAAQEDISQARGGHFPTVNLTGRVGESEQTVDFPGVGETNSVTETVSVGVQLSLPIFSGGTTSAQVDEAQFTAIQARQDLIRSQRQVELDARTGFRNVQAAAARVQALTRAIESAETAVAAAKAGLQTGTRNILDVLEAELDLIQRRVDQKTAWYDYAVAGLRLKLASGVITVDDLRRVNARLAAPR